MRTLDIREKLNVIVRTWPGSGAVLRGRGVDDLLGFAGTSLLEVCRLHHLDASDVAQAIIEASGEEAQVSGGAAEGKGSAPADDGMPDVARLYKGRPGTERLTPPPAARPVQFPSGPTRVGFPAGPRPTKPTADEELELEEIEPVSDEFGPPLPAANPAKPAPPPPPKPDDIPDVAAAFKARPRPANEDGTRGG